MSKSPEEGSFAFCGIERRAMNFECSKKENVNFGIVQELD
jgi:hypothetical protein